ncbi:mitochondrial carrier protein [Ophiostoma piceae UAMH 11346]|uniref:Mitochondrial carrier protein n=1 Tax=Ophiostoma piceae (strain UAMH 11346) TaxID=1262450 RepID=S3CCA2_OPHP1|nr:mitochondrial carrier protein [Ophiostoma piceae UAMH 11346]
MQSRDYIKTYADSKPVSSASSKLSAASASARRAVPSPYALRGLYQGIGSVLFATLPASGVFFTTYESAKTVVGKALPAITGGSAPSAVVHSLSSGIAELTACVILTPAEVIKQNAQMIQANSSQADSKTVKAIKPSTSSSLQALRMLLNAEGGVVRRLLSGYTALAARNLPFTALQFPMFESLRVRLRARWSKGGVDSDLHHKLVMTGAVNGLSAGTSGAIAAVVTTPTDVIKTRMMLAAGDQHNQDSKDSKGKNQNKKNGAVQLTKHIYKEHGIRGLFRGGLLRAGWTFVGSGLYLGTYEMAKVWLRGGREGDDDE